VIGSSPTSSALFATTFENKPSIPIPIDFISANDKLVNKVIKVIDATSSGNTVYITFHWSGKVLLLSHTFLSAFNLIFATQTFELNQGAKFTANPTTPYHSSTVTTARFTLGPSGELLLDTTFGISNAIGFHAKPEDKIQSGVTFFGPDQRFYSFLNILPSLSMSKEHHLLGQFVGSAASAFAAVDEPIPMADTSPRASEPSAHGSPTHSSSPSTPTPPGHEMNTGSVTDAWIFVVIVIGLTAVLGFFAYRFWLRQTAALARLERANRPQSSGVEISV